jgi:hypothetical protein
MVITAPTGEDGYTLFQLARGAMGKGEPIQIMALFAHHEALISHDEAGNVLWMAKVFGKFNNGGLTFTNGNGVHTGLHEQSLMMQGWKEAEEVDMAGEVLGAQVGKHCKEEAGVFPEINRINAEEIRVVLQYGAGGLVKIKPLFIGIEEQDVMAVLCKRCIDIARHDTGPERGIGNVVKMGG